MSVSRTLHQHRGPFLERISDQADRLLSPLGGDSPLMRDCPRSVAHTRVPTARRYSISKPGWTYFWKYGRLS